MTQSTSNFSITRLLQFHNAKGNNLRMNTAQWDHMADNHTDNTYQSSWDSTQWFRYVPQIAESNPSGLFPEWVLSYWNALETNNPFKIYIQKIFLHSLLKLPPKIVLLLLSECNLVSRKAKKGLNTSLGSRFFNFLNILNKSFLN